MRIGVIGAGNIGQALKAMLASVDAIAEITLADNAGGATSMSMSARARIFMPSCARTTQS